MVPSIEKVQNSFPIFPIGDLGLAKTPEMYESSLTSLCCTSFSLCKNFFNWIFSPLFQFLEWIRSNITLVREELEIFENLIEGCFWGSAKAVYDFPMGVEQLREVLISCDQLDQRLSKKWFPNIEGILFLRWALLKIKIRVLTALGEEDKATETIRLLESLGCKFSEEMEFQRKILALSAKPSSRSCFKGTNYIVKKVVGILTDISENAPHPPSKRLSQVCLWIYNKFLKES